MSDLKYKLEKLLPSLVAEARSNKDPEVKKRFYLIKAIVAFTQIKSHRKVCRKRVFWS